VKTVLNLKHFCGHFVKILLFLFAFLLLTALTFGLDYSLEFSQFGISGGISQTMDYQVVDIVTELGTSGESQSSGSYAFKPIIGFEDSMTSVSDWTLY